MRNTRKTSYWWPWVFALTWTIIIFKLSSGQFSAQSTGGLVDKIIFIFWPKISLAHLDLVHFIIRKLAHLSVYGILSLLWSWVFKPEAENWNTVWVTKVLFICLCAASLDETHQSLIQSRTGSPIDVIIDISGAGLAQVLWRTYFKKVKKITRGVN